MKLRDSIVLVAAIVACAGCHSQSSDPARSTGAAAGFVPEVPEPVAKPWSPLKNDLPPEFVEATKFFQSHGMGDPRNGKFVQALSGAALSEAGVLVQPPLWHGWLARQAEGVLRFTAIDGLSYDLYSKSRALDLSGFVGGPTSQYLPSVSTQEFESEQSILLTFDMGDFQERGSNLQMLPTWQIASAVPEDAANRAVPFETFAALCLIDGEPQLAKTILSARSETKTSYLLAMANELLQAKWIRALDAYGRGDDQSALALFKDLDSSRTVYAQRVREKLGKAAPSGTNQFRFLDQVPGLIAETQRRLSAPKAQAGGTGIDQEIRDLENFGSTFGQKVRRVSPEIVESRQVPVRLLRVGMPALDPLIKVLGDDNRLTREIVLSGDSLKVVSVRELALRLINALTGAWFHLDQNGKISSAAQVASWWAKNSMLNAPEREFQLLADDSQDDVQWIFAAKQLAGYQPDVSVQSRVELRWQELKVKGRRGPSVSDLMARRMNQFLSRPKSGMGGLEAKVMYTCLQKWDPQSSQAALKTLTEYLITEDLDSARADSSPHLTVHGKWYVRTDPDLLAFLEQRIGSGDATVVPEYRALLLRLGGGADLPVASEYKFCFDHRNDRRFEGLIGQIFVATPGADRSASRGDYVQRCPTYVLCDSPFMTLPETQDAVARLLKDKTVIRTETGFPQGVPGLKTKLSNQKQSWQVRACDEAELKMSTFKDPFAYFLPTEQKDAILQGTIAGLERHSKISKTWFVSWN